VAVAVLDAVVPELPVLPVVGPEAAAVPQRQLVQPIPAACTVLAAACVFPVA
jgi:hypothetical protein